jgi:EmrB/QacA subfamily drug resistance transporter
MTAPVRPASQAPARPVHRRPVLIALMTAMALAAVDTTIVSTAIPQVVRDLGGFSLFSWVFSSYLLTQTVTIPVQGRLADQWGRKPVLIVGTIVFLAGSALCASSTTMVSLILFRGLQGIGGGGLNSLVQAILGDVVPARQRSRYQAYVGIVATVALIAGPFLGGLFAQDLSWRWIFYINLPVGITALAAVAARLQLPRPAVPARSGRVDIAGGLLATVLTTAVLLGATWGGTTYGWSSAPILALGAVSVAALGAYLITEHRAAEPITPLHLFRNSIFTISSAQFLLVTMVLFVALLYVPEFLQAVQHRSAFTAGLFDIPLLVGLVLATALAGPRIARTGRYRLYPVIGSVLTGASMWALSLAGPHTSALAIIGPLVTAGAGIGFGVQVALLAGQNAVEHRYLGVATGALNFFKSIGGALGAAVFGAVLAAGLGAAPAAVAYVPAFDGVFRWTVPFMGLALILALVMREKPLSQDMIEVAQGNAEVPEY